MIVITAPTGLIGHQVLGNVLSSGEPVIFVRTSAQSLQVLGTAL